MVLPQHLIEPINALQQNMFINAPTISQTAALKCWDQDTIEVLESHVQKYKTSRDIILKNILELEGVEPHDVSPSDGAFYIYVDLRDKVAKDHGSVAMCKALLEEEFVAFTPGVDFEDPSGPLGDRRFRISYAGGIRTAEEAMKRLSEFWPTWLERVSIAKQNM